MEFKEAKEKFIHSWGALGSSWGINKAMAQIHALLIVSPTPLSTDQIMEELQISRGNANMNIRGLLDWGIVHKEYKSGDRKEYFSAGKDIWELARQVTRERRRREIEPILKVLSEAKLTKGEPSVELSEFKEVTSSLFEFSNKMDNLLARFEKADESWFSRTLLKLMK